MGWLRRRLLSIIINYNIVRQDKQVIRKNIFLLETHLKWRKGFSTMKFHPMRHKEELVSATLVRSSRTNGSF